MNAPQKIEISKTADFCRNFPQPPVKAIPKDNLLEHVEEILSTASKVVYLEGDPLAGKSEFSAEFMRHRPHTTVGVFLSAGTTYFYTPEYVKLVISEQIHWLVKGTQANFDAVDDVTFARFLFQLQKLGRQSPIIFVVDGLAATDSADHKITKEILNLLPFGQTEFKFVISGSSDLLPSLGLERWKPKNVPLIRASIDEAYSYFSELKNVSKEEVYEIRQFCGGVIGQMARFSDLIASGVPIADLLNEKEGTLRKLLEFEWAQMSINLAALDLLGYIAFATHPLNLDQLSSLSGLEKNDVEKYIKKCHAVEIDETYDVVSIRSDAQKRFLREKLAPLKDKIHGKFIEELMKNHLGQDAVRYLPGQLMVAGKKSDLIECLDNDHFVRLLESERSLRSLRSHSELGLAASRELGNDAAETRFALSSSVITGLTFSVGTKSQIEALLKLGEKDNAIGLALAAPTSEEKLQLLAVAAKAFHDNRLRIAPELKNQIRELVAAIDHRSLGYLATDIACDLLVVDFDLAMKLFEGVLAEHKQSVPEEDYVDVQEALPDHVDASKVSEKSFGKVHAKLSNRHKQRFADAVATLVERISAEQLLLRFEGIEERHLLFILKQWLQRRKADNDAWKVADYALNVTLRDLTRAPRIQDFREIAVVLPYIEDVTCAEKLARRIEAQLGSQLSHGTTVESVRLEMLLLRVQYKLSQEQCELSLIDLFSKVHQLPDVSTRATCWAWMLYALQRFPDPQALDGRTSVVSEITQKLVHSIETLLESSADHYQTARSAIYALARANPELAIQLVSKLNTQERRDRGFRTLASELVSARSYIETPGRLLECIKNISDEIDREGAILNSLSSIAEHSEMGEVRACNTGILALWRSLRVAHRKIQAAGYTYRIIVSTTKDMNLADSIASEISDLWPSITVDWVRADVGYCLVRDLAGVNRELAKRWLEQITNDKKHARIPSEALSNVLYMTVKLAVRSYAVIAPKDCELSDPQFSRISFLINSMPVISQRLRLWCELGTNLHFKKKHGLSKKISTEFVQAIIQQDYTHNELVRDALITEAAPILFLTHAAVASLLIERIAEKERQEVARHNICDVLFTKKPLGEPYKVSDATEYELDFNDAASVLSVLKEMVEDSTIIEVVQKLCNSLVSKKNTASIRRTQVRDFLNSLQEIVDEKLPDKRNIRHDGYRIAATAYILRARATLESIPYGVWESLHLSAKGIPNIADRVVVVTIVGASAKGKGPFSDLKWFEIVKEELIKIPSDFDRIDRYQWVGQLMEGTDKKQAVGLLREAMSLCSHLDEESNAFERRQKILDLAHSIDETLVDRFIDLTDADEARASVRDAHLDRINLLNRKKDLAADPACDALYEITQEELSKICFENLGSLASGRILPRPIEDFEKLARIASSMSMSLAFPVWSWIIENAARKGGARSKGEKIVEHMYEATCHAAELTLALIGKTNQRSEVHDFGFDGLIKPGDREAVYELIRQWSSEQDGTDIRISDPYFGPEDLDVLHAIAEAAPNARIRILTSRKHVRDVVKNGMADEAFQLAWKDLCDLPPPSTEIVIVGIGKDGGHPIHDRWIVNSRSGLRLGTSTNSMGYIRLSEISKMNEPASKEKCVVVDELLNRERRDWFGDRLQTTSFDLY